MLNAFAGGPNGSILYVGLDDADIAHLVANKPIHITTEKLGMKAPDVILLFETDPMVSMYSQFPLVLVVIRQSTLDVIRTAQGFLPLAMKGPGIEPNTHLMLFHGHNDDTLRQRLQQAQPQPARPSFGQKLRRLFQGA